MANKGIWNFLVIQTCIRMCSDMTWGWGWGWQGVVIVKHISISRMRFTLEGEIQHWLWCA